ncbi:uncharacterized protein N7511_010599 [Penicillium nucicola]|uniref:uncharacterized protein n=1 Tax=Penicillium nucicola TaxID=1850975 RepID=UPI002545AA80|nr:uncharacterized protein N7511_010599 [Penicillium nucicola]KAJ5748903.1 hypothetical protein N7511_010599 [Penicillium nucicola]
MPTKRIRSQKKKKQSEFTPESSEDEWVYLNHPTKKPKTIPKVNKTKARKAPVSQKDKKNTRNVPSISQHERHFITNSRSEPRWSPAFYAHKPASYLPVVIRPKDPPILDFDELWDDNVALPMPRNLIGQFGDIVVPNIYFGDTAPMPRWRVARQRSPHQLYSPETNTNAKRSSVTSTSSSGSLSDIYRWTWVFEAGEFWSWGRLEYDQLYEYAYMCLFQTIKDPFQEERIRHAVFGPSGLPADSPPPYLPALPGRPHTRYFELEDGRSILNKPPSVNDSSCYLPDYRRPSLSIGPDSRGVRNANVHVIPQTMFNLMRESLTSTSADSRDQSPSSTSRMSTHLEVEKVGGSGELEPVKDQDLERNDEGRTARFGEYRFVWFCVIFLVLCMFLCLFLYVFKVFKR